MPPLVPVEMTEAAAFRDNMWAEVSGYSLVDVVVVCAASVLLMATIVIGNVLVIIAIFNEISLNSEQNWDEDDADIHATFSKSITLLGGSSFARLCQQQ